MLYSICLQFVRLTDVSMQSVSHVFYCYKEIALELDFDLENFYAENWGGLQYILKQRV